jgi:hypothetical protein
MSDFTLKIYIQLISNFKNHNYKFQTIEKYLIEPSAKVLILRHDVDKRPVNSLVFAELENNLNVKSTYYFRLTKDSFNEEIIKKIVKLGHEIGYHYEDLALAKGDFEKAIYSFKKNLGILRKYYPVKTVCMHGSPLSAWNNIKLWEKYKLEEFGIIGEPYISSEFKEFFYLTDTGRKWNNNKFNFRDKINSGYNINICDSRDISGNLMKNKLPDKIIISTHPQRWDNNYFKWTQEFVYQNIKNIIKYFISSRKIDV